MTLKDQLINVYSGVVAKTHHFYRRSEMPLPLQCLPVAYYFNTFSVVLAVLAERREAEY